MITNKLFQQFIFWGVWLVIPLMYELIIGIISALICVFSFYTKKNEKALIFYPNVSILVPIYNSCNTLEKCLDSILCQTYPLQNIEIILINNGSEDKCYSIFQKFQSKNMQVKVWWINSKQGKAKALNKGIFCSSGNYIINIDSDGWLDKNAVKNIITKFENNSNISALTGVIMTEPELIEDTKDFFHKLLRRCEHFEYNEAFLVGRNYYSKLNSMYTLSGAFSCFRRDIILKTPMYNFATVGEDTHMTFQIRKNFKGTLALCENAFFYVDPIENLNKLYTQRQRWQRGQIEVANLYSDYHIGHLINLVRNPIMKIIVSDHTLVFPRLIWFFGMIYLYYINYPLSLLIASNLLIYVAYTFNSFIYLNVSALYLKDQKDSRKYILSHWYIVLFMAFYRFLLYWIRLAGIINSTSKQANWKTLTFSQETFIVVKRIKQILYKLYPLWKSIYYTLNNK